MDKAITFNQETREYEVDYVLLQPHQKRFYDTVQKIIDLGITPTPKVVNQALGKANGTSWNGPLVLIRTYLLQKNGYVRVYHESKFLGAGKWRWEKN
jgi:hypothetical protein